MKTFNVVTQEDLAEIKERLDNILTVLREQGKLRDGFYTNEELSKIFQVSKRTLQNYRDENKIEFCQIGRKIYYPQEAVNNFINQNKNQTTLL